MYTKIFETEALASEFIVDNLSALLKDNPHAMICIAAGQTSLPILSEMKKRVDDGLLDVSNAYFIAMDEWKDVPSDCYGSCANFLKRNMIIPLGIKESNYHLFDSYGGEQECKIVKNIIENHGGIDFLVLGIGLNGHLALNEPGSKKNSSCRVVTISDTTLNVAPKYFNDNNMPEISGGLTIGLTEILAAKEIYLAAFGSHKKEIIKKLEISDISANLPASFLKDLNNAYLVLDKSAYS